VSEVFGSHLDRESWNLTEEFVIFIRHTDRRSVTKSPSAISHVDRFKRNYYIMISYFRRLLIISGLENRDYGRGDPLR
jgi:hypothetical protein